MKILRWFVAIIVGFIATAFTGGSQSNERARANVSKSNGANQLIS